mmetsp:Transcript_29382/g.63161  ORF Transcript_29382/g.63161 Transcript_29382/m.63161 type:complete len:314 (-) Transcript_29382:199-1140(-)
MRTEPDGDATSLHCGRTARACCGICVTCTQSLDVRVGIGHDDVRRRGLFCRDSRRVRGHGHYRRACGCNRTWGARAHLVVHSGACPGIELARRRDSQRRSRAGDSRTERSVAAAGRGAACQDGRVAAARARRAHLRQASHASEGGGARSARRLARLDEQAACQRRRVLRDGTRAQGRARPCGGGGERMQAAAQPVREGPLPSRGQDHQAGRRAPAHLALDQAATARPLVGVTLTLALNLTLTLTLALTLTLILTLTLALAPTLTLSCAQPRASLDETSVSLWRRHASARHAFSPDSVCRGSPTTPPSLTQTRF